MTASEIGVDEDLVGEVLLAHQEARRRPHGLGIGGQLEEPPFHAAE